MLQGSDGVFPLRRRLTDASGPLKKNHIEPMEQRFQSRSLIIADDLTWACDAATAFSRREIGAQIVLDAELAEEIDSNFRGNALRIGILWIGSVDLEKKLTDDGTMRVAMKMAVGMAHRRILNSTFDREP
jgi:hypothetical protein